MIFHKIFTLTNKKMLFKRLINSSVQYGFSTNKTVFLFGGQGNQ